MSAIYRRDLSMPFFGFPPPEEILIDIFSYDTNILTLALVCKTFKKMTENNTKLWNIYAEKLGFKFLNPELHPKNELRAFFEIKKTNLRLYSAVALRMSPTAFKLLPTLELGNQLGENGKINFVKATDMTSPIMKGIEKKTDKPFLAVRFKHKKSSDPEEVKVVVFSELNPLNSEKPTREVSCSVSTSYNIEECLELFLHRNPIIHTAAELIRGEPISVFAGRTVDGRPSMAEKMDDGTNIVELA